MADNYLEKKMEDLQNRLAAKKAKEQRARQRAWKKRMDAYRRQLEISKAADQKTTLTSEKGGDPQSGEDRR